MTSPNSTGLTVLTVCGLWVQPDVDPHGWNNFSWNTTVVDDPAGLTGEAAQAAVMLAQADLMEQVGLDSNPRNDGYAMPTAVGFATLHPLQVDRAAGGDALNFADLEVPGWHVDFALTLTQQTYTVCGLLRNTWRAGSYLVVAGTPEHAYLQVWQRCQNEFGEDLLLAAVHEGRQPVTDTITYADPLAHTPQEMATTATTWGAPPPRPRRWWG